MICKKLAKCLLALLFGVAALLSACGSKKNDSGDIQDKFGGGSPLNKLDTMLSDNKPAQSTDTVKPVAKDTVEKVLKTHNCDNDYLGLDDINALRKLNRNKKIDTIKAMCFSFVRVRTDSSNSLREYGRGKEYKPEYSENDYGENIYIYDHQDAIAIYTYYDKEFLEILEKVSADGRIIENNGEHPDWGCRKEYQVYLLNGSRYIFFKIDESGCKGNGSYKMGYVIFIVNNSDYNKNDEFIIFD